MGKNRLEAFSDGVIAIIITIMVLEMKVPHGESMESLKPLIGVFLSYVLSFVYVGIYWNNHHHMLHASRKVRKGRVAGQREDLHEGSGGEQPEHGGAGEPALDTDGEREGGAERRRPERHWWRVTGRD